ncbi:unnamed protein product [Strongylus vulgaris]|uniref:Endonuclease/exonuclease/phosphatase domain-containing protein n=1 Tax=Strongylus vulgaris TaxID=40348 RepID=A0A3P7LAJ6_STRVU|nr:unnamed protein product [Strongylus vulgaris]
MEIVSCRSVMLSHHSFRGEKASQNVGALDLAYTSVVHLSVRMRSYHFAFFLLRPLHQKTITIFTVFSTSAADDSELEAFHEDLEQVIRKGKFFYIFVMGDFNAKIEMSEEGERRIGRFGLGLRNKNGNRLVELLTAARLFMATPSL